MTEGNSTESLPYKLESRLTSALISTVQHSEFENRYQKGFYQRETHSKKGEHILLTYNDHSTLEQRYVPPRCFIQAYPPGHTRTSPDFEDYRWYVNEDPEKLYPDKIKRIEELIALFKSADEDSSD